jgi:hypothetical protein
VTTPFDVTVATFLFEHDHVIDPPEADFAESVSVFPIASVEEVCEIVTLLFAADDVFDAVLV